MKKRKVDSSATFLRRIQICFQNRKIPILKFWPPIGGPLVTPWPLTSVVESSPTLFWPSKSVRWKVRTLSLMYFLCISIPREIRTLPGPQISSPGSQISPPRPQFSPQGLKSALLASNQPPMPQICPPDLKSALQTFNQPSKHETSPPNLNYTLQPSNMPSVA